MVKNTSTIIEEVMTKRAIIRGKKPFVKLSLALWEQVEDILKELSSPRLTRSIRRARQAYQVGRAISYDKLKTELKLS